MGICDKCQILSPDVIIRQCDDKLCGKCEKIRVDTLAEERRERQLRRSSSSKSSPPEEDGEWSDSSKSAGNNDRVAPRGGSGDSPATSRSSRASEPMPADSGSLNTAHGTGADVAADADRNDNAVPSKQKPSASNKKSKSQIPCISGCKFQSNKGGGDSIRCCLCMQWFHGKCVRLTQHEKIGLWSCPNCRDFAKDIKRVDKNLLELSKTVSDLSGVIKSSEIRQTSLESEIITLKELNSALLDQNDRLVREIRALKADFTPQSIPTDVTPSPERSLIIGSSMIRNFD